MTALIDLAGRQQRAELAARDPRTPLFGLTRGEVEAALGEAGVPAPRRAMRRRQIWNWLYVRGATTFSAMSDLSRELRDTLAERHTLERPEIVCEQVSADGTRKWLLRLAAESTDARAPEIETVFIPEGARGTLCLSSQVGCTLTCSFCHTGTQRLVRNLTAAEIIAQILLARDRLGDWRARARSPAPRVVTNIVMMGMGEPLYNFDAVAEALRIASDGDGLAISRRRITLSTSGVAPMIERVGSEIGVMLAISLHAADDATRNRLVPINRKYPIAELMNACRGFPGLANARRITFEYVMLKGVNDSVADARRLVRLVSGIPAKINLIPFNPWPGAPFECSDWDQIERFAEIVQRAGYASPVRSPRGRDIMAACGQLRSDSERLGAADRGARAVETAPR
jgi:23S rRNA (adenine2503-C2)-methyltransferase